METITVATSESESRADAIHSRFSSMSGQPRRALGHSRTKVTLACGACRKRRVKCSGSVPCTFCVKNSHVCFFDGSNQGRRGPRPHRPPPERIIHHIAPAPRAHTSPPLSDANAAEAVNISPTPQAVRRDVPSQHRSLHQHRASAPRTADDPAEREGARNHEQDDADESESELGSPIPESSTWVSDLTELLSVDKAATTLSTYIKRVIPSTALFPAIRSKTASLGLVYAMCALSIRYSLHPTASTSSEGLTPPEKALWKLAKTSLNDSVHGLPRLDYLRTLSVLIEYDAASCNGQRAWIHIAMLRSLVQLYRAGQHGEVEGLFSIETYLAIAETTHSLGHETLRPLLEQTGYDEGSAAHGNPHQSPMMNLTSLLRLMACIDNLATRPHNSHDPEPWKQGSGFRKLHTQMEEYIIHHPGASCFETSLDNAAESAEDHVVEAMCSLVYNCCDVLLNRIFLPIPACLHDQEQDPKGSIQCVDFPGAPSLFLLERMHRCEASAAAICRTAKEIVKHAGFFWQMPLLGYCCLQSSLVVINQMQRSSHPNQTLSNTSSQLKFLLVVLAAVRRFYAPAQTWLEAALRVQDPTTMFPHAQSHKDEVFSSYFSRYVDIPEPCFVPLVPSVSSSEDGLGPINSHGKCGTNEPGDGSTTDTQDQAKRTTQQSWAQIYVEHLSGNIVADDEDQDRRGKQDELHSARFEVDQTQLSPREGLRPPPFTSPGNVLPPNEVLSGSAEPSEMSSQDQVGESQSRRETIQDQGGDGVCHNVRQRLDQSLQQPLPRSLRGSVNNGYEDGPDWAASATGGVMWPSHEDYLGIPTLPSGFSGGPFLSRDVNVNLDMDMRLLGTDSILSEADELCLAMVRDSPSMFLRDDIVAPMNAVVSSRGFPGSSLQ